MVTRDDLFLVDLAFLLEASQKSFYGAPLLPGPQGEDYTVLYGVTRDLLRLRKLVGIRNAVIVIGGDSYKVSTPVNIDKLLFFLGKLRATIVHEPSFTVGSLCRRLAVIARWVVTLNNYLFQLVSDDFGVIVPDFTANRFEIVTPEALKVSLSIRSDQVPAYLALTEGGKKALFTKRQAIRLLEVHGDLKLLLQDLSVVSSNRTRRQLSASGSALLARLCDIEYDEALCQIPAFRVSELPFIEDDENSRQVLRENGFLSLVRLLPSPTGRVTVSARESFAAAYRAIQDEAGLRVLEELISKSDVCAVDTEASDKDPRKASLFGVAFSVMAGEAFYVPVIEADLKVISPEVVRERLRQLLGGRTKFVGHNLKYDYVLLLRHGIKIRHAFFDTMLAAYECFGDWEMFHLGFLSSKLLGKDIKRYKDIVGEGQTLLDVPFHELLDHGCTDADITLRLYYRLREELEKRKLLEQFTGETMALLRALALKECSGVRLNLAAIRRRRAALAKEADALRGAVIAGVGEQFDLDSPTETAAALRGLNPLFEHLGRRRLNLVQMEQLAGTNSLMRSIVKYNRKQKLIRQLDRICGATKDGRVFPIFSQVRWAHGALSSADPKICEPAGALESTWVIDKDIRERMVDLNRSLETLQKITGDEFLERDCRNGISRSIFLGEDATAHDFDEKDLVLSLASGISDAALRRRFLIDQTTVVKIQQALKPRYAELFTWLDIFLKDAVTQGFASHDGKRKYLQGLRSSDLHRRDKAMQSAVRWLIKY